MGASHFEFPEPLDPTARSVFWDASPKVLREALIESAHKGHVSEAKWWVNALNANAEGITPDALTKRQSAYDQSLEDAAAAGHVDMVQFLLPLSDPNANDGNALKRALFKGHGKVIELLAPVTDVVAVRRKLIHHRPYRWDLADILAQWAPPDIQQAWLKKDGPRLPQTTAMAQAQAREKRALIVPEPAVSPSTARRRARP